MTAAASAAPSSCLLVWAYWALEIQRNFILLEACQRKAYGLHVTGIWIPCYVWMSWGSKRLRQIVQDHPEWEAELGWKPGLLDSFINQDPLLKHTHMHARAHTHSSRRFICLMTVVPTWEGRNSRRCYRDALPRKSFSSMLPSWVSLPLSFFLSHTHTQKRTEDIFDGTHSFA